MRTQRAGLGLALLALLPMAPAARAETGAWVATVPVQTGAEERVEVAADRTSVWAVIDHSRVLRSTDRGLTWLPVNPVPVSGVPGGGPQVGGSSETFVAPLSAQVALGSNGGAVSRTTDGGLTWSAVTVPAGTRSGYDSTAALKPVGGGLWLVRGGFEVVDHCAVLPPTTQVLTSRDGVRWAQRRLPVPDAIVTDLAVLPDGRGAVAVYDMTYRKVDDSTGCGYEGVGSRGLVLTTLDAGRTWRRSTTCAYRCSLAFTGSGALVVGGLDGTLRESRDLGRTYRPVGSVPVLPAQVLGLQALDCVQERCWALINGTGIYRRDRAGEWVHEPSDADALGVCVANLSAIDLEGAVAAGPHALMSRVSAPVGAAPRPQPGPGGAVDLGRGAVLGADGVVRIRVVLPH